jgi:hypothetical protein
MMSCATLPGFSDTSCDESFSPQVYRLGGDVAAIEPLIALPVRQDFGWYVGGLRENWLG